MKLYVMIVGFKARVELKERNLKSNADKSYNFFYGLSFSGLFCLFRLQRPQD